MKLKLTHFLVSGVLLTSPALFAQEQQPEDKDLYELSLEELMNVPINSASKKDETLFDAPLSSYTITRADIEKAGSTSIMEALRLAPGVIVREQTNGVYDIHIRGFDNILRTSEAYTKSNLTTLVMIDNRPVFNHNLGGTFWEALPVDLVDVERIEIVRGPSAPLFGPNAVTGVINIITKRVDPGKTSVNASVQAGSPATTIANAAVGKSFGKFSVLVSGNYQKRARYDEEYFVPATQAYLTLDQIAGIFPDIKSQYPHPDEAMNKFGVNAFMNYAVSEAINFDLSVGTQQAKTQKIFLSNVFRGEIPFTQNETETSYINLAGKVHGFNFRTSYMPNGHDNLALNAAPNQYDYDLFDANVEYDFKLGNIGTLVPGVSYQSAVYNDLDYVTEGLTFLNGKEQSIRTASGFIRTDLKPIKALRIMAAVRLDKFSVPDDAYFAYELATTYKLNDANLVRFAITRSNSGSFIGNNYLDLQVPLAPGLNFERIGSENLKLLTVNMIELGYRAQLSKSFQLDVDVFRQQAENFTALMSTGAIAIGNGLQVTEQQFLNIPTTAEQIGATLALNFVPNDKLQVKPFVTIQKTETKDMPSAFVSSSLNPGITYNDLDHENTPAIYGGYFINYKATRALNINLNGYFSGAQHQYDGVDPNGTGEGNISGKVLLNAKVSYAVGKASFFVNGRNLFNNNSREFFGADQIGGLYTVGAAFHMN